jgi:hypothetical protein
MNLLPTPNIIMSIFTLSAISPEYHRQVFQQFLNVLFPSTLPCDNFQTTTASISSTPPPLATTKQMTEKYILFRDYGIYDYTMLNKHTIRYDTYFFQRLDKTFIYYFSLDYLQQLIAGLNKENEDGIMIEIKELSYATVVNKNRKTKEELKRVFVHAVFAVRKEIEIVGDELY